MTENDTFKRWAECDNGIVIVQSDEKVTQDEKQRAKEFFKSIGLL